MINLKDTIRSIPDFPVEKIIFRDITTLMDNPLAFQEANNQFYERYKDLKIDKVVGIDARGFVFGAVLAYLLKVGFVPVRKKGKLPFKTISQKYALEYGTAEVELHEDAIQKGERVVIIDDLIATGGTIAAAIKLVEKLGGEVVECAFVVELPSLNGRKVIEGHKIFSLVEFEGA
jgi:adenine phosphoribosyltransferase